MALDLHPGTLPRPPAGRAARAFKLDGLPMCTDICTQAEILMIYDSLRAHKPLILMVPLPRLERGTPRSTIWCSNQLSYSGEGVRNKQRFVAKFKA